MRPVPLFVSLGRRRASDAPPTRRPAAAAAGAAATGTIATAAATAAAAAPVACTATPSPRLPLPSALLARVPRIQRRWLRRRYRPTPSAGSRLALIAAARLASGPTWVNTQVSPKRHLSCLPPLLAFATTGPGHLGGGKARLLDFGVDKAAEGDVAEKAGSVHPGNAGKGLLPPVHCCSGPVYWHMTQPVHTVLARATRAQPHCYMSGNYLRILFCPVTMSESNSLLEECRMSTINGRRVVTVCLWFHCFRVLVELELYHHYNLGVMWIPCPRNQHAYSYSRNLSVVCRDCRLKMLRNKRYSNLRLLNSLSTTFSLTKPDLSLLASKSGTPMRL